MEGQEASGVRVVLPRKQHRVVTETVRRWHEGGVIDDATRERLLGSMQASLFDWQRAARYAFLAAIACTVIALSSVMADRVLMAMLERFFNAPALVKCGFFALVAAGLFRWGLALRARSPLRVYRNEAVFFFGVLALAVSIGFLGVAIDSGSGRVGLLLLFAALIYAALGVWFPSSLVWVFALISLGGWLGAETGYVSGWGAYYLGMNFPLRFVLFGGVLALAGVAGERLLERGKAQGAAARLLSMSPPTKVMGLLYGFIALWLLSIFGNYGDLESWRRVAQIELFHWSLLFGAAAVAAIWYGLRHDDGVMRGFGITFLCINLYTRYFEFFWDATHKAVFFAILALSCWFLGSRAEKLWNFGRSLQRTP